MQQPTTQREQFDADYGVLSSPAYAKLIIPISRVIDEALVI
jgi:hypothetical protein